MVRRTLTVIALAGLAGCGGGNKTDTAAADSLNRDLQMAPAGGAAALNDKPAPPPAPKPAPKPVSRDVTLPAGATVTAGANDTINSRHNKAGETVHATVGADIKNSAGKVVIPAGSVVELTITELKGARSKSDKDGELVLTPSSVTIGGKSYTLAGTVGPVEHTLRGQGVTAGGAARVGAGAAVGAIAGKVIGGNKKGAIIG
ncbi:MAG: hypothetical protein ACREMO_02955, partial [Gemmatimonadales bacterium]